MSHIALLESEKELNRLYFIDLCNMKSIELPFDYSYACVFCWLLKYQS